MMGERRERTAKLFHFGINLDERVPDDHVLRRVHAVVDFGFVREVVAGRYGGNGHLSEDPIVLMKLMFLLFFEDVKSERELLRTLPMRLDWLWFCGYDIDDAVPNHSVLSKARARWGAGVFEDLFVRVVGQCVEAGLVDGAKIHMDGSLIRADAAIDSARKGPPELIAALRAAYGAAERKLDGAEYYEPKNARVLSTTDPDAVHVFRAKKDGVCFRYKEHRVVDDCAGVVTAIETTPGDTAENAKLPELVDRHEAVTGATVGVIVADKQYGTNENFAYCAKVGIQAHMGDLRAAQEGRPSQQGIYDEESFRYDPENDSYTCPAGERLKRRTFHNHRKGYEYKALQSVCRSCALKPQCTRAQNGRSLFRHRDQDLIDRARAQSHSRAARRDRRRRKTLMEGSFADAANNHHFKRARWRRLRRQRIQGTLIATCQNIRILLRATQRTRPAQAELAIVARTESPLRVRTLLERGKCRIRADVGVSPRRHRNGTSRPLPHGFNRCVALWATRPKDTTPISALDTLWDMYPVVWAFVGAIMAIAPEACLITDKVDQTNGVIIEDPEVCRIARNGLPVAIDFAGGITAQELGNFSHHVYFRFVALCDFDDYKQTTRPTLTQAHLNVDWRETAREAVKTDGGSAGSSSGFANSRNLASNCKECILQFEEALTFPGATTTISLGKTLRVEVWTDSTPLTGATWIRITATDLDVDVKSFWVGPYYQFDLPLWYDYVPPWIAQRPAYTCSPPQQPLQPLQPLPLQPRGATWSPILTCPTANETCKDTSGPFCGLVNGFTWTTFTSFCAACADPNLYPGGLTYGACTCP